jgi:hypothetical protein
MSLFWSPNGMRACRSSSLIAPEARRRDATTLTSSSKKMRLSASLPRFGMNLRLRLRPPPVWYHDTTHECQSIEATQRWGGLRTFVASDLISRIDAQRTAGVDVEPTFAQVGTDRCRPNRQRPASRITEYSASLGVRPRAGLPGTYLQATAGSQRHFRLVKVLPWTQSQLR